jgi:DNA excision repair protein ERCC-6
MGLGKTAQVVTLLASLKHSGMLKRALIVCPATVMGHWAKELTTWYPPLRVVVFHESGQALSSGRTRRQVLDMVSGRGDADVMITTYGGVRSFREALLDVRWDYVILDEADRIRNPDADISLTCKQFRTTHRLAMTGSPIQNNLKEVRLIFGFRRKSRLSDDRL